MVTSSDFGYTVVPVVAVPRVMGLDVPVTPLPPLTSFIGCRSRLISSLISAPNGLDYIEILGFVLHPQLFRSNVCFSMAQ
jgi:hypothetical protein